MVESLLKISLTLPGADIKLDVESESLLMFDLNASDKTAPVLTVTEYQPFQGRDMYLKGSMTNWLNEEAYMLTTDGLGIYQVTATLDAGDYEFKIADADWQDDSTLGGVEGSEAVALDTATTLTMPGANLTLSVAAQGSYLFTVDATNPSAVTLTVVAQ